jgi:uncharacterized membrane protein YwzB
MYSKAKFWEVGGFILYKEQIFREELAKAKPPSATSLMITMTVKLECVDSNFFVYSVFTNSSDLTY